MKAKKTFFIGLFVLVLSIFQLILSFNPIRIIGIAVGLFFVFWGWKIGWARNRNLTVLIGHLALVVGGFVISYAIYQLPFIKEPPTVFKIFDMPLFWGIFTIYGGNCMINHAYCNCTIKMHNENQTKKN
ncbi:MAG: hypothetical protein ACP5Q5_10805 [Brevinematia bacterium]